MRIRELRILPPFAIGRLGSAWVPLDSYTVAEDRKRPLDFRRIRGTRTLVVDEPTGEITHSFVPRKLRFRQGRRVRPVAPFLEVFAVTDDDVLEPLTLALLQDAGLAPEDVQWRVTVANRKVERRTANARDVVTAQTPWFSHHDREPLIGHCPHFVEGGSIPFGDVRYIRPNSEFPEIRLRFTPAAGLIYGTALQGQESKLPPEVRMIPPQRRVYDPSGGWYRFQVPLGIDNEDPDYHGRFVNETLPPSLFAIFPPAPPWLYGNQAVSRGYLDDTCDGLVEVSLQPRGGQVLTAAARVCSAPPVLVPDARFVRTLADDLDQVLHGPSVPADEPVEVTRVRAEDIVRRAYETVRFMNVAVMNGNPFKGRPPLSLDTMPAEEAFDTERLERPVMPTPTVDTLAILALHQEVFTALRGGVAPWFLRIIRRPDEVTDFRDRGRRKMPALMCGADNNYLALTHLQIDTLLRATSHDPFHAPHDAAPSHAVQPGPAQGLTPRNLSAQLHYAALGNPVSAQPENAIANCCPGLEVDFRGVWRRMLEGIVLREYDNLVVDVDPPTQAEGDAPEPAGGPGREPSLKGHRLLRIRFGDDSRPRVPERVIKVVAQKLGPSPADPNDAVVLSTADNPEGVAPLEWSNTLAHVLSERQGLTVWCDFTEAPVWLDQVWWDDGDPPPHLTVELRVRRFFEDGTAVIARALAQPGELTQGLCSPWQNDYRECSCYYWASARPDFVNVQPTAQGTAAGDNWLQKQRTGSYVPDDYLDSRLILYDELFRTQGQGMEWEKWLRFQIRGRDNDTAEGV